MTLAAALLNPDLPLPPGLTDPQGRPAPRRFAVLRNNVAVGLRGALEQGFPVTCAIVGPGFFAAMAQAFLRTRPPRSPLLWQYGADMPAFIAAFPPAAHLPYLPDVARLEQAIRHSYHAADAVPLGASTLAMPAERLLSARLVLSPAVQVLRSAHPVWSIWQFHHGGPPPQPGPQDTIVVRPGYDPIPLLLPDGAADFLGALQSGATVLQAIDAAGPSHPLSDTLTLLFTNGAVCALHESS